MRASRLFMADDTNRDYAAGVEVAEEAMIRAESERRIENGGGLELAAEPGDAYGRHQA